MFIVPVWLLEPGAISRVDGFPGSNSGCDFYSKPAGHQKRKMLRN